MFWSVYLLPSFLPCIYICSRIFATNWDLLSQLAVSLHFCNFVLFSSLRESCIFAGCAIVEKGAMYTGELMTFPAILQIWSGSHSCCNICSSERSGHPRREPCDQLRHAVSHWGVCPPYWFISSCAELMTFPASAPQLVYQMLWYVPPCLCSSAYTRAGHCVPVTGFYLVLTSINVHHSPTSIMITVQQHEEYSDPTSQSCCWHQYHFPEQVEIFNSIINTRSNIYSST